MCERERERENRCIGFEIWCENLNFDRIIICYFINKGNYISLDMRETLNKYMNHILVYMPPSSFVYSSWFSLFFLFPISLYLFLLFLSLRFFRLLFSSLLWFPQCFGLYVLRPSSGVFRTREPTRNFDLCPLLNPRVSPVLVPLTITGYKC